jgi:rod shape-determining protein MreC
MPAYTSDSGDSGGRRQVLATAGLFVLSLITLLLPEPGQQQVASTLRATVLRPFVSIQQGFALARSRTSSAGVLRRQVDSLVAATSGHLALEAENRRLRNLLQIRERLGPSWIPAGVVRSGTAGSESTFMVDVGSEDGVTRYSPVISAEGVVGRVQEVYPKTSIVIDWTHPDFRVSAVDPAGTTTGIAQSRRGEFREADRLEFNGTAYTSRLEDGTPIVTSGLGGVFPAGIPIGKVDGLAEADAGWRKSYWLRPMVEVGGVTHVLVGVEQGGQGDLSAVWPADSVLTGAEWAMLDEARQDSLETLRTILTAPLPIRDSLLASLLLGTPAPQIPAALPGLGGPPTGEIVGPALPTGRAGTGNRSGSSAPASSAPSGARSGGQGAAEPPNATPQPATQPPPRQPAAAPPDTSYRWRFPVPTDTVRVPRPRPDTTLPGGGVGARPDTTRSREEGGASHR